MNQAPRRFLDRMYGAIELPHPLAELAAVPAVQRLRHVRLSNIDSISMPGIANVSRFEHVLGVSWLALKTRAASALSMDERLSLAAAGLLHDAAITAFGHLVEDAFQYAGIDYDHEAKWKSLLHGADSDFGGANTQVFLGRESGLATWASRVFGSSARDRLEAIVDLIQPTAGTKTVISGDIDLDNIDNVCRVAHCAGIDGAGIATPLAEALQGVDDTGVRLGPQGVELVRSWLRLRRDVYERLMTSRSDFAAKVMVVDAVAECIRTREIIPTDWRLVDYELVGRLLTSESAHVSDTTRRWLLGDLWALTPLFWVASSPPLTLSETSALSGRISGALGKHVAGYRINDKRVRAVAVCQESPDPHAVMTLGARAGPREWLVGFATADRRGFTRAEIERIRSILTSHAQGELREAGQRATGQLGLF